MATQKYLVDLEVDGDVTADAFIKDGGTSSQFLKADGSVDSSTYLTTDDQTLNEVITSGNTYTNGTSVWTFDSGQISNVDSGEGWGVILSPEEGLLFTNGSGNTAGKSYVQSNVIAVGNGSHVGKIFSDNLTAERSFELPNANGTLALTSQITDTQLTAEQVQDIVGAMVAGNTEESISVTYTDGDGKLNFDATNEVSIGVSGAASGQVAIFSGGAQVEGYSSFTYDEANEDLTVGNNITAAAYINVPVIINCNFSHTSTNTSIWQNLPFNSLSENATAGEQHNWLAPKDGRIRKILFKNTSSGTTPSASRCAIRIQKNGSVVYTQALTGVTGVGYGISHVLTLSDTNVLFSEFDLIRIQFNSNGTMQDIAASTVIEFTE